MSPRTVTRSPLVVEDIQDKDPSAWSEDEHRFMQDRGLLPDDVDRVPVTFHTPDGRVISNDAAFFAGQAVPNEEEFNSRVEERARALAAQMVQDEMRSKQHASGEYHGNAINQPPAGGTKATDHGSPSDEGTEEGEVDYNKLHNDDLRAECARRNLSVDGNKKDLVARLERDDDDALEEGDEA